MVELYSLSPHEMQALVTSMGQPRFRADQIWRGLYRGLASEWNQLTSLPTGFREKLARTSAPLANRVVTRLTSRSGDTVKVLLEIDGGELVEVVVMFYPQRVSACISTQVGCGLGCAFCATGQTGFVRNLTSGEIVRQVVEAARIARTSGRRLSNLVFMGMGEPMQNWDNLWKAISTINHPAGLAIGARHITVSTVGIPSRIRDMARVPLQVGLAVSLHAPNDALRRVIMPIAAKHPLSELLDACREYTAATRRRITFEYVMLRGFNDSPAHARELAELLRGMLCQVNLIPMNPVAGSPFQPSDRAVIQRFRDTLAAEGISCTVRAEMGQDIDAACGQLRARSLAHARATL
jgi:23S rRNA (adenine2503-C2)-methyltransferase